MSDDLSAVMANKTVTLLLRDGHYISDLTFAEAGEEFAVYRGKAGRSVLVRRTDIVALIMDSPAE